MSKIVYCYEVVVPYPVPIYAYRKEPNLTLDELAITNEEIAEAASLSANNPINLGLNLGFYLSNGEISQIFKEEELY